MTYDEWLNQVKELFQNESDFDYHEVAEPYNFLHDFNDGKTPKQAMQLGIAMLDA